MVGGFLRHEIFEVQTTSRPGGRQKSGVLGALGSGGTFLKRRNSRIDQLARSSQGKGGLIHAYGQLPGPPWVSLGILQVFQTLAIWRTGLSQGWRLFSLPREGLTRWRRGGGFRLPPGSRVSVSASHPQSFFGGAPWASPRSNPVHPPPNRASIRTPRQRPKSRQPKGTLSLPLQAPAKPTSWLMQPSTKAGNS